MGQVTQTIPMRYINKTKLIQYCVKLWGAVTLQVCLNQTLAVGGIGNIDLSHRKRTLYISSQSLEN